MVVDDDKNTRLLFRTVLEAENYNVVTASNGEEALEVLDREHIDLVVLDIMMPKMSGYEFTKEIRGTDENLPILMVSARQLPEDKHKGFLVGTDDYMTKPIDQEELLLRIKALLRRAKIASERKIVVGDVVLDYDALTVTRSRNSPKRNFCSCTSCCPTRARYSPAFSSWTRYGGRTARRGGRRLRFTSAGCGNALRAGRNSRFSPCGDWATRQCGMYRDAFDIV